MNRCRACAGAMLRGSAVCAFALAALLCAVATARSGSLVGAIYVKTDPAGARIYVSGEQKGTSPCTIPDVGIGEVEVKAELEGYASQTRTVSVAAERIATVEFTLEPLTTVGHITVLVEPAGAAVELDRVPFGKTPARLINIQAGTHRLKVSKQGYLPFYADVTVVSGRDRIVTGKLQEGLGGAPRPARTGAEPGGFGELDPDQVPLPDEMPEAKAFEPVRKLLKERDYDGALRKLDEMSAQEEMRPFSGRIGRDRRYILQVRDVVQAGYRGLKDKVGLHYSLPLKGGITVEGRMLDVDDEQVWVELQGSEDGTRISLDRIRIDRVVKLAAPQYPPHLASNQALFAILYAMEGEYERAYDALRQAATAGYNVTDAKSYVDGERLWAAAEQKARLAAERARRREELERRRRELGRSGTEAPVVLVDARRGSNLPQPLAAALRQGGLEMRPMGEKITEEALSGAAVVVLYGPGPRARAQPLGEGERGALAAFLSDGGGLVVFGAPHGRRAESPYAPLLRQLQIIPRADRLFTVPGAPRGVPAEGALGVPVRWHPVTEGISGAAFPTNCSLSAPPAAWLMGTARFVESSLGAGPVPLVAAREAGKGRAVVFSGMPELGGNEIGRQGLVLAVNAIRWAAYPKSASR